MKISIDQLTQAMQSVRLGGKNRKLSRQKLRSQKKKSRSNMNNQRKLKY